MTSPARSSFIRHPSSFRSAFTLAENLFAMAILAFALLSIIGLMPSTLSELNDAERRIAEARILQSLSTEFQTKSWNELIGQTQQRYYFDNRGIRTGSASGGSDPADHATLAAAVYVEPPAGLPGDQSTQGKDARDYLRKVTVVITNRVNSSSALQNQSLPGTNRVFAIYVASQMSDEEMQP